MSWAIGIDIGFDSQVVERLVGPIEGETEPSMEIQKTEKGSDSFDYKVEYSLSKRCVADQVEPSNSRNVNNLAIFSVDYLQSSLNIDSEKEYSEVSLSKKNNQIYFTFPYGNGTKELSASVLFGLMFLYEHFSVINPSGQASDRMLTYMFQDEQQARLMQLSPIYAVPHFAETADVQRLQVIQSCFHLPPASYVCRSIPLAIGACYKQWRAEYEKDNAVNRTFALLDFGYTSSHIYLISIKHTHWKIRCHLHSTESTMRKIETALAETIKKANPDYKWVFKQPEYRIRAHQIARQNLKSLHDKREVKVDEPGFVVNKKPEVFTATVTRDKFEQELERSDVLKCYSEFIASFVDVLTEYKITVDRAMIVGSAIHVDKLVKLVRDSLRGFLKDNRLKCVEDARDVVAKGALLLQQLILGGKAAIDPSFIDSLFWPTPQLQDANKKAWEAKGTLKITHTRTNVSKTEGMSNEAKEELTKELNEFVERERQEEGERENVAQKRAELIERFDVMKNDLKMLQEKVEEEKKKEKESRRATKEKKEGEEEKEGEDNKVDEKDKTASMEAIKELDNKLRELGDIARDLEKIEERINSDGEISVPEKCTEIDQALEGCYGRLQAVAITVPDAQLQARPVIIPQVVEEKPVQRKKRRGCCKGKSDVVEMGP